MNHHLRMVCMFQPVRPQLVLPVNSDVEHVADAEDLDDVVEAEAKQSWADIMDDEDADNVDDADNAVCEPCLEK